VTKCTIPLVLLAALLSANPATHLRAQSNDPGCENATLVSTGGDAPRNPQTLAVRWTGFSNFELAYKGQVILLDAYFDRGAIFPPLGFTAAAVTRANVILLGHGHADHMSDAASVAIRTGAVVVGAPLTVEKLRAQGVDPRQLRTVSGKGGEALTFSSITVEPILGRHGEPPRDIAAPFSQALQRMPAHHDGSFNELWRATEPLFQALKDENPKIVTISKSYREPSCFDTTKKK
jgi:hypothetical protein